MKKLLYLLSIALKSLGYGANSTNPDELDVAMKHLEKLIPHVIWWDPKAATIVLYLPSPRAAPSLRLAGRTVHLASSLCA